LRIEEGLVVQYNSSLTSLEGLNNISSVGGHLFIRINDILTDIDGLGNLTTIGDAFDISNNPELSSISDMQSLTTIGGDLTFHGNYSLTNISGLINLNTIEGDLTLSSNTLLCSLSGLDNINPNSINNIEIFDNTLLSECDVYSICQNLASPNGEIVIENNTPGCNSPEEVEESCFVNTNEISVNDTKIQIFPNPAKDNITILCPKNIQLKKVCIYNQEGRKLLCKKDGEKTIDVSEFQSGLYFIEIKTINGIIMKKLIID